MSVIALPFRNSCGDQILIRLLVEETLALVVDGLDSDHDFVLRDDEFDCGITGNAPLGIDSEVSHFHLAPSLESKAR